MICPVCNKQMLTEWPHVHRCGDSRRKHFVTVQAGEWVQPTPRGYLMRCCDCNLVHRFNFRIIKYAKGKRCKIQFQAFRVTRRRKGK